MYLNSDTVKVAAYADFARSRPFGGMACVGILGTFIVENATPQVPLSYEQFFGSGELMSIRGGRLEALCRRSYRAKVGGNLHVVTADVFDEPLR